MHPLQVFQRSASFPCNTTSDSLPIQVHSALYVFGQAAAVAQKRIMGRRNRIRSKAHGNSGIADGVQGDESIGSPEGQDPEMLVDPDWVDTDQPLEIGNSFCIFTPPRQFSDEMIGARSAWARLGLRSKGCRREGGLQMPSASSQSSTDSQSLKAGAWQWCPPS